jgi:hypothetical protein
MTAARASAVAAAAGISAGVWSSTTTPRVFPGKAGFIGGRNRGRLPFLEIAFTSQSFQNTVEDGGTLLTSVELIAHGTGRDQQTAEELLSGLLGAALASIRTTSTDNYIRIGDDQIEAI